MTHSRICFCFIIVSFLFNNPAAKAQNIATPRLVKMYSVLGGLNAGKTLFGEVGLARNSYGLHTHHPMAGASFISCEFGHHSNWIVAPKIGGWVAGGVAAQAFGINAIAYLSKGNFTPVIRPEYGFGFGRFKCSYGYNLRLKENEIKYLNKHVFSVTILFPVKQIGVEPLTDSDL
ncbi:MAG: hypothetical protein GC181_08865 [Bacteroidetes bacterium]|nr:hypothetical protein [Bacteroidota bacterium]